MITPGHPILWLQTHPETPVLCSTAQNQRCGCVVSQTPRSLLERPCSVLDTLSRFVLRRLVCFTRSCLVNELLCYLGVGMTLHPLLSHAQTTFHKSQPPMSHSEYCSLLLNEASGLGRLVGKERTCCNKETLRERERERERESYLIPHLTVNTFLLHFVAKRRTVHLCQIRKHVGTGCDDDRLEEPAVSLSLIFAFFDKHDAKRTRSTHGKLTCVYKEIFFCVVQRRLRFLCSIDVVRSTTSIAALKRPV